MTLTDPPALASTATRQPGRLRRAAGWVLIAVLVLGVSLVGLQLAVQAPQRDGFDPEGRGYNGTLALAELLRQQGITVTIERDRFAAARALDDQSTLVLADPPALSDDAVDALFDEATSVVVLTGSSRMLRLLDLGSDAEASGTRPQDASCRLPELDRVGAVTPGRLFLPSTGVTACFTEGDGAGLLVSDVDDRRRTIIDGSRLFTNEHLATDGNAALGLALLGQQPHVVWYVPSYADTDLADTADVDTLGSLTPPWVTPAILLLLLAGVAAGIWRGRRFGPLVVESLPVMVRASETMLGRARLTAKAADARHAAEAVRDGTLRRLATRMGLSTQAPVDAIADAVADRMGVARGSIRDILAAPLPTTDAALVPFARHLSALEAAVDDAVRTERNTP